MCLSVNDKQKVKQVMLRFQEGGGGVATTPPPPGQICIENLKLGNSLTIGGLKPTYLPKLKLQMINLNIHTA